MGNPLEYLYTDKADIYTVQKTVDSTTKRTKNTWNKVYNQIPCRISFKNSPEIEIKDGVSVSGQAIRLFLANTYNIPKGSIIEVTRQNKTSRYEASSEPAIYQNHQEINLARKDRA